METPLFVGKYFGTTNKGFITQGINGDICIAEWQGEYFENSGSGRISKLWRPFIVFSGKEFQKLFDENPNPEFVLNELEFSIKTSAKGAAAY